MLPPTLPNLRRNLLLIALSVGVVASTSCEKKASPDAKENDVASNTPAPPTPGEAPVRTYGALRAMMHDGATAAQVELAAVLGPNAYAVGALSELRGEVTIVDGRAYIAYPGEGDDIKVEEVTSSAEAAALLVSSTVAEWQTVKASEEIPFEKLDAAIEKLAQELGIDTSERFTVRIEGGLADVQWHVIDGAKATPDTVHSHEGHRRMAVRGELAESRGTLIGFFSKNDQGVFTHMGSNTHLHVVDVERGVSGHVDSVRIRQGASLSFPKSG